MMVKIFTLLDPKFAPFNLSRFARGFKYTILGISCSHFKHNGIFLLQNVNFSEVFHSKLLGSFSALPRYIQRNVTSVHLLIFLVKSKAIDVLIQYRKLLALDA
jgi:hypothetical protein